MEKNDRCGNFVGLTTVNVELTSRCNKDCWMCGRRKIDRDYPEVAFAYGDMDFALVERIAEELPDGIVVQLHNNGEPLLYPRFGDAAKLFEGKIRNIVTNGKLLVEKADEIIGNLETMAISVFENDEEADEQYETIVEFLKLKGDRAPHTILRLNGDVVEDRYLELGLVCARRILHAPGGSFNYRQDPTIPEVGFCLDFMNHLAINKDGDVSICVRFDPKRIGVLGSLKESTLSDIWNGEKRTQWKQAHLQGRRQDIPLCSYCHFWGVPTGRPSKKTQQLDEKSVLDGLLEKDKAGEKSLS